jgi:hypothetical protein
MGAHRASGGRLRAVPPDTRKVRRPYAAEADRSTRFPVGGANGRARPRPIQRRAPAPHQALRTGRQAGASTRSRTKTTTAPTTRARRQRLLSQPAATPGIAATESPRSADAGLDDVGRPTPRRVLGAVSPLRRFGTTESVRRGAPCRLARRFLTPSPVRAATRHAGGRDAAGNCTPALLGTLGGRGVADRPPRAGAELAFRSLPTPGSGPDALVRGMARAPGVRGPFAFRQMLDCGLPWPVGPNSRLRGDGRSNAIRGHGRSQVAGRPDLKG